MPSVVVGVNDAEIVELPAVEIPGQIDGRRINYEAHDNHPTLKRAADTLSSGHTLFADVSRFRANPSDEDRAATHARKVRDMFSTSKAKWSQSITGLEAELTGAIADAEANLRDKAKLKADPRYEGAILAKFVGMKPADQQAMFGELITAGDGPSLAALLEAPVVLTGLTVERKIELKAALCAKVAPKEVALRDELVKAKQTVADASIAALQLEPAMLQWTGPGEWKDRAKEAAAKRAGNQDATIKAA